RPHPDRSAVACLLSQATALRLLWAQRRLVSMPAVRRASPRAAARVVRLDRVLFSALRRVRVRAGSAGPVPAPADGARPLVLTGAVAAAAAAGTGLAILTLLAAIGWGAAPHARAGLSAGRPAAGAGRPVGPPVGVARRGAG